VGVRLPYDEAGEGAPVILLHAGVADRTMWREHLGPLAAAGYRAIAVDLPAFGEAPAPETEDPPWNDVLDTMYALGIERAALVGNSFGGAVALRVGVVAPERVSALALISVPPTGLEDPSPELRAAWEAENAAIERGDVEAAVVAAVDAWTLPDAPPELRARVVEMQRRAFVVQGEASRVPEAPDPLEEQLGTSPLASLDMPALVAVGEREQFTDFREGARALAQALPDARHAVIPGAGHLAPLEAPSAFRALLLEFLGESRGARSAGPLAPGAA
jgi:pimeloyl-ACP methyl ester carboxylesterase